MKDIKDIPILQTKEEFYNHQYPEYLDIIDKAESTHWKFDETNIENDFHDLKTKLTKPELHGLSETLKLFTLYETRVGQNYWSSVVGKVFGHPEIKMVASRFAYEETCFHPDTEYLTPKGWVKASMLGRNTKVCQYNPETRETGFVLPTAYIEAPFEGDLIHLKTQGIEQLVTPNHRIIYEKTDREDVNKSLGVFEDRADEIVSTGDRRIYCAGKIVNNGKDSLTFLDRLKIATQAVGRTTVNPRCTGELSGCMPVQMSLKKKQEKERLRWILGGLPFEFSENSVAGGYSHFYIEIPLEFYSTDWETFDWVDLEKYNHVWFSEFLFELREWGGCSGSKQIRYSNTELKSVAKVQAISVLAGIGASIYDHTSKTPLRGEKCETLRTKDKCYVQLQDLTKDNIRYKGKVYCITVPSGALITRYNNKVSVSGNTHARSYSEINRCLGWDTEEYMTAYKSDKDLSSRMRFIDDAAFLPKGHDVINILTSIGSFALIEGAVLFSNFAYIKHFKANGKNLLTGITSAIDYSVRDEERHCAVGIMLFNTLLEQACLTDIEKENLSSRLRAVSKKILEHEEIISGKIFRGGRIVGITQEQICRFVNNRIMLLLEQYNLPKITEGWGKKETEIEKWFYSNIRSIKLSDFFVKQSTAYSRHWNKSKF